MKSVCHNYCPCIVVVANANSFGILLHKESGMIKHTLQYAIAMLMLFSLPVLAQSTPLQTTSQLTPQQIAQASKYHEVELSPDGKHLAVVLTQEGQRKMVVFDAVTFKMVGSTVFAGREQVGTAHWVNNERLVIKVFHKRGWLEELQDYGELYAVNYDGSRAKMIYGYRSRQGYFFSGIRASVGWAHIIDYLPNDEQHILIESEPRSNFDPRSNKGVQVSTVHKLNVYTGELKINIAKSPIKYSTFFTDQQSNLRLVLGTDDDNNKRAYKYIPDGRNWEEIPNEDFGTAFLPLGFNKKGDSLYVIDNHNQDKMGLFKLNLETGERKHLYTDKEVDITNAVFSADKTNVYALRIDPGYPAYVVFNHSSDEAKTFKSLINTFAGHDVRITSQSDDGSKSVVAVASDINPTIYYLYDKPTNKLSLLFNNLGKLAQNQLSTSAPVSFATRDGVTIHGYFSRPVAAKADKKIPMVTLVHGGPHDVRDYWLFDREVQLLTSLGYAVLRVNYRGSEGYGKKHMEAGYTHWGDLTQHDIIDGTKWGITNQNIDANKVCIMGTSFGGYSAVQSAILEPDLFKCVVANAGVYDLEMMFNAGDILERGYGESYLEMALGTDKSIWRQFSPVHNVDKLKAAIMIAHGEKDKRVPFEHAEKLAESLKKSGKDYKWFTRSTEAHGFYSDENRGAYFQEVADFLKEHLQ